MKNIKIRLFPIASKIQLNSMLHAFQTVFVHYYYFLISRKRFPDFLVVIHLNSVHAHWLFLFDVNISSFFLKILFICFQREGKRRRKRGRETSICGCLSHTPYWGPGLQPRHVPWLGIEPVTLWFTVDTQSTELHQPGLENISSLKKQKRIDSPCVYNNFKPKDSFEVFIP